MNQKEYEDILLRDIITKIEKYGGRKCLSSIILTGSFGREEPTYAIGPGDSFELKSDVEIALVFPNPSDKKHVYQIIEKVSSEFEEDLNLMAINEKRVKKAYNFNFSLKSPRYKTIFTYDLFNGSKTIWGHDFLSETKVELEDVDIYEAKRLVANRIGELIYLQNVEDAEQRAYLRTQWKGKLMLAIVSAWLICEGEYVSSYHGQYNKAEALRAQMDKQIGTNFFENYSKVFGFLRDSGNEYEVEDYILCEYVKNIDAYFKSRNISKPKVNSISRILKYCIKYLKTGMQYGLFGFENNILQALIVDYHKQDSRCEQSADIWHKVLY